MILSQDYGILILFILHLKISFANSPGLPFDFLCSVHDRVVAAGSPKGWDGNIEEGLN